jgi:hypothetical protein
VRPRHHRLAQVVQLHAALAVARPYIGERVAELRVPHERRQVIEHDRHANVVDRAVGRQLDRPVGHRVPAEEPHVACPRQVDRFIEIDP